MKVKVNTWLILMAKANLNMTQLSEKSGVTRQTLSSMKKGRPCTPSVLVKVANAIGVEPEMLIEDM